MKGKRRYIAALLLIVNMIMLAVAVLPHHHHADGAICVKQDLLQTPQCPNHYHHPGNDSCCDDECRTRFQSPAPSIHVHSGPDYVFIATLFTDELIERLLKPQEKRLLTFSAYRSSLHSADFSRTISLRAPPRQGDFL